MEYLYIAVLSVLLALSKAEWDSSMATQIKARAADKSLFWFGTSYLQKCAPPPPDMIDCINVLRFPMGGFPPPPMGGDSINTMVFYDETSQQYTLNRELAVTYTVPPGSYEGCDHEYDLDQSYQYTLDPLSDDVKTPWEVRQKPIVSWTTDAGKQYTLMVINVAFGVMQALYTNLESPTLPEEVDQTHGRPYVGSRNMRPTPTPMVFFLFEQTQNNITLDQGWIDQYHLFSTEWAIANLTAFLELHPVTGPIAMNWVMVGFDAWAAQGQREHGYIENCSPLVEDAVQSSSQKPSFLPDPISLPYFMEIDITTPSFCCHGIEFEEETVTLDPITPKTMSTVSVRTDPNTVLDVTLSKRGFDPDPSSDFDGTYFTLIAVDLDVPNVAVGTTEYPLVHWLVTNIPNGKVEQGREVASWVGPMPPNPATHRYMFLLYQQASNADLNNDYNKGNCSSRLQGRCLFDVKTWATDNSLTLVGFNSFLAEPDEFTKLEDRTCDSQCDVSGASSPKIHLTLICIALFSFVYWLQ